MKMPERLFINTIFFIILYFAQDIMGNTKILAGTLLAIMKYIRMNDPLFIEHGHKLSVNTHHYVKLMKEFSKSGQYLNFVQNGTLPAGQCFIWNIDQLDSNLAFPIHGKSIVLTNMTNEKELSKLSMEMNQEVYIFDWKSMKLFETYSVNEVKITNVLGQFNQNEASNVWIFYRSILMDELFERRRGNFHGKHLIGMTSEYAPSVVLPKDFEEKVKYYPENETYEVTEFVSGTYIGFLHLSQSLLNFTSTIYMRKDRVWGNVLKYENGSIEYKGMLENVCGNSADFIWTVIARTIERDECLDYLPNMNAYYGAIYLPGLEESYDWSVFIAPFTTNLWIAIVTTSLINALLITLLERINFNEMVSPLAYEIEIFNQQ